MSEPEAVRCRKGHAKEATKTGFLYCRVCNRDRAFARYEPKISRMPWTGRPRTRPKKAPA